jgi:hypothetical protein
MDNNLEDTLSYNAIKAFLKATKAMLEQHLCQESQDLIERVKQLETLLEVAYTSKNTRKLYKVSQKADDLALDLLDYLDTVVIPNSSPSRSLQA